MYNTNICRELLYHSAKHSEGQPKFIFQHTCRKSCIIYSYTFLDGNLKMLWQMLKVHEKVKNYNQLWEFSDKLTFLNFEVRFIRDYLRPIMEVLVSSLFWVANFSQLFFNLSFYDPIELFGNFSGCDNFENET